MESRIWLPSIALVLTLAFTYGDALKCYECKSVGKADDSCSGEMLKSLSPPPVECSVMTMRSFHHKIVGDPTLKRISNVFEVFSNFDQHRDLNPPMACVKMNLRVDNQPVVMRTCQTAKTAEVDPCKTIREKISSKGSYDDSAVVEYCGMCETDQCNGSYSLSPTMILAIVPLVGSILMSFAYNSA